MPNKQSDVISAALLAYVYHEKGFFILEGLPENRLISFQAYVDYFSQRSFDQTNQFMSSFKMHHQTLQNHPLAMFASRWGRILKPKFPKNDDYEAAGAIIYIFRKFFNSPEANILLPSFLKLFPETIKGFQHCTSFYKSRLALAQALFEWFSLNRPMIEEWYENNNLSYERYQNEVLEVALNQHLTTCLQQDSRKIACDLSRFIDDSNLKEVLTVYDFVKEAEDFVDQLRKTGNFDTTNQLAIKNIAKIMSLKLLPSIAKIVDRKLKKDSDCYAKYNLTRNTVIFDYLVSNFGVVYAYAQRLLGRTTQAQAIGALLYSQIMTSYIKPYVLKQLYELELEQQAMQASKMDLATLFASLQPSIRTLNKTDANFFSFKGAALRLEYPSKAEREEIILNIENIENILRRIEKHPFVCEFADMGDKTFYTVYGGIFKEGLGIGEPCEDDFYEVYQGYMPHLLKKSRLLDQSPTLPKDIREKMYNRETTLDLSGRCLTDQEMPALKALLLLPECETIYQLKLSYNNLSQEGSKELVEWILQNKNRLVEIDLTENPAIEPVQQKFFKEMLLKNCSWTLEILENYISKDAKTLNLSYLGLLDGHVTHLKHFFDANRTFFVSHPELEKINLSSNALTIESVETLSRVFSYGKQITHIDLTSNPDLKIKPHEQKYIRDLLHVCPLLTLLPIEASKISCEIKKNVLALQTAKCDQVSEAAMAIFTIYKNVLLHENNKDVFTEDKGFLFPSAELSNEGCLAFFKENPQAANNLVRFFYLDRRTEIETWAIDNHVFFHNNWKHFVLQLSPEQLNHNPILQDVLMPSGFMDEADNFLVRMKDKKDFTEAVRDSIQATANKLFRFSKIFSPINVQNSSAIWERVQNFLRPIFNYADEGERGEERAAKLLYWQVVFQKVIQPVVEKKLQLGISLESIFKELAQSLVAKDALNNTLSHESNVAFINIICEDNDVELASLLQAHEDDDMQRLHFLQAIKRDNQLQAYSGESIINFALPLLEGKLAEIANKLTPSRIFGRTQQIKKKLNALIYQIKEEQKNSNPNSVSFNTHYNQYLREAINILQKVGEYRHEFSQWGNQKENINIQPDNVCYVAARIAYVCSEYFEKFSHNHELQKISRPNSKSSLENNVEFYAQFDHICDAQLLINWYVKNHVKVQSWYESSSYATYEAFAQKRQYSEECELSSAISLPHLQTLYNKNILDLSKTNFDTLDLEDVKTFIRNNQVKTLKLNPAFTNNELSMLMNSIEGATSINDIRMLKSQIRAINPLVLKRIELFIEQNRELRKMPMEHHAILAKKAAIIAWAYSDYLRAKGLGPKLKMKNYQEYEKYYKDPHNILHTKALLKNFNNARIKCESWYRWYGWIGYNYKNKLSSLAQENSSIVTELNQTNPKALTWLQWLGLKSKLPYTEISLEIEPTITRDIAPKQRKHKAITLSSSYRLSSASENQESESSYTDSPHHSKVCPQLFIHCNTVGLAAGGGKEVEITPKFGVKDLRLQALLAAYHQGTAGNQGSDSAFYVGNPNSLLSSTPKTPKNPTKSPSSPASYFSFSATSPSYRTRI